MGRWLTTICKFVTAVIIATKAEVNPANKCQSLVDDNYLLMMGPEEDAGLYVIWMTKHLHNGQNCNTVGELLMRNSML